MTAEKAKLIGAAIVHYSTDCVFGRMKVGCCVEDDATDPLKGFGKSTLSGECAVIAGGAAHLICVPAVFMAL